MSKIKSFLFIITLFSTHLLFAQEICLNGIDDDGDGLIDLNDPDCVCSGVAPSSLIYNHSFENLTCCPSTYGNFPCLGPIGTGNVFDPSGGSPDLFNTCDWTHFLGQVGLLPFPDGNGAAGFFACTDYREHVGGCVTNTLIAGTSYTFQFSFASIGTTVNPANGENESCALNFFIDTIFMELYGSPNCPSLYNGFGCPTTGIPGTVLLGSAAVSLNTQGYQTITMTFTPAINVNQVILQFPCNLPVGWYDLSTKGSLGFCSPYAVVDNLILNNTSSFSGVSIVSQGNICTNNLTLIGNATQPGTFQWFNNGIAIIGQTANSLDISTLNLPTGMYQVLFDDGINCSIDSFFVNNNIASELIANDTTICLGDTAELVVNGGSSYTWLTFSGNAISNSDTLLISPSSSTSYLVSGTLSNGCQDTLIVNVIIAPSPNDVSFTISPIPVETEATISLSNSTYTYSWLAPDSSISNENTLFYSFPNGDGTYEFMVTAQNAEGCFHEFIIPVNINSNLLVYVPNAFTPDENEFNDVFKPIISDKMDKTTFVFKIYNRWGEMMFESRNIEVGWDGTYQLKKVPSGVYSWVIEFNVINIDEPRRYNGHVKLLR